VEDGVRLEVLDWGGPGRPVVLLPGDNTAHVFDDFAVKLSETSRVYRITRRGFGASSHPKLGYRAQQKYMKTYKPYKPQVLISWKPKNPAGE
jgi:pimeloyl-ACP methyl ester carboxylesterase